MGVLNFCSTGENGLLSQRRMGFGYFVCVALALAIETVMMSLIS